METTKKKRKSRELNHEKTLKRLQKLFKERGSKALEMARKEILQEKIECREAGEALRYFMREYWNDLARPTLLSLACEAVGGDPELTTPIAVPMILISGAIDIHDDIIDESKTKNGRPTVYGKYGEEIALLVGDALLFKGLTMLNQAPKKGIPVHLMPDIFATIKKTFFELGDAEALELRFRGRTNVSPKEYLDMVRKKAADVEAYTRISAILGGGSKAQIKALSEYGRLLGMMVILQDDLVDITEPAEVLHRIKKESLPIPLLYALQNPMNNEKIKSFLHKKRLRKKDAETILSLTYEAGGIKCLKRLVQKLTKEAETQLTKIKNSEDLKVLLQCSLLPFKQLEEFFSSN